MNEKEFGQIMKRGESETVEFKKSTGQLDDSLKHVCGFLNHKGGTVYFGISDKAELIGQDISDSTLKSISQKIRFTPLDNAPLTLSNGVKKIKPEVSPEIRVIQIEGRKIIEVKIKEGSNKPYYLNGIAYKRTGTESPPVAPEELERIILRKSRIQ